MRSARSWTGPTGPTSFREPRQGPRASYFHVSRGNRLARAFVYVLLAGGCSADPLAGPTRDAGRVDPPPPDATSPEDAATGTQDQAAPIEARPGDEGDAASEPPAVG